MSQAPQDGVQFRCCQQSDASTQTELGGESPGIPAAAAAVDAATQTELGGGSPSEASLPVEDQAQGEEQGREEVGAAEGQHRSGGGAASKLRRISANAAAAAGQHRSGRGAAATLPLHARIAAQGLSVKLFPHQIPEVHVLCQALDLMLEKCGSGATQATSLCVAVSFLMLRAIRGVTGVEWAASEATGFLENLRNRVVSSSRLAAAVKAVAAQMLRAHDAIGRRNGWASHREGRHGGLSGRWAIEAMSSAEGARRLASACSALAVHIESVLRGESLSDGDVASVLSACRKNLPLAVRAVGKRGGKSTQVKKVLFADAYNAVNAGAALLAWLSTTFGTSAVTMGPSSVQVAVCLNCVSAAFN